jgi:hypothetical protein
VEAELHGNVQAARPAVRVLPQPEKPAQTSQSAQGGDTRKATNKQIKYVLDLAQQHGIGLGEINARVQKTWRVGSVYDLSRAAASQLVDELKQAA